MREFATSPIRKGPELERYQQTNIIYLLCIVVYSFLVLVFIVDFFLTFPRLDEFLTKDKVSFWWLFMALQFTFTYVSNRKTFFYWQWIEQRRFASMIGGHAWDAVDQPAANPVAFDLPATIALHANIKPIGKMRTRIFGLALVYILIWSALGAWSSDFLLFISQNRFYNFLLIFAFLSLLVLVLFSSRRFSGAGIKVVVTEQGVRVGKSMVKWEEARLFAMYKGLNAAATTYELSSATDIVRWTTLSSPEHLQIDEPNSAPVDGYSWRVRALNEVIVARTGLPLSDLR